MHLVHNKQPATYSLQTHTSSSKIFPLFVTFRIFAAQTRNRSYVQKVKNKILRGLRGNVKQKNLAQEGPGGTRRDQEGPGGTRRDQEGPRGIKKDQKGL